jgi:hypothetical protein
MKVLLQKKKQLMKWLETILSKVIVWAAKDVRKLKDRPPEITAWQIIKLLA